MKYLLIFLFSFANHFLFAQNDHPIDAKAKNCLQQKNSAFGTIECELERYRLWSEELDKTYDSLNANLDTEGKKLLKEQQISWAKYRDLQFAFNEKIYGEKGGVWLSSIATQKAETVRKRVFELKNYLELTKK